MSNKITDLHEKVSYKEAEEKYNKKMSYAEELQRQMREKKEKEDAEKRKKAHDD